MLLTLHTHRFTLISHSIIYFRYLSFQTSGIFLSLKKGETPSSSSKESADSSSLRTTLDYLARSCLSATPKVDSDSLTTALNLCTSLSDEAIQGFVSGYESVTGVDVSQQEHTSHVSQLSRCFLLSDFCCDHTRLLCMCDPLLCTSWYRNITPDVIFVCQLLSQLGRLFDLQWKLGVAVSSSNCSNLSAPFVALSYKISDSNGQAQGYAMELSFSEFQVFQLLTSSNLYPIVIL